MRSHRQNTVHLPVEIQLSDDNQFLQKIRFQNCVNFEEISKMSDSDSEGSVSDLNSSGIIQESDNEDNLNASNSQDGAGPSQQKQLHATVHKSD